MNKDLLIKLAKLANNNSNENEANLAARKVCRMLAEDNFNFIGGDFTVPNKRAEQQPSTWNPFAQGNPFDYEFDLNPFLDVLEELRRRQAQRETKNPGTTVVCKECGVRFKTTDLRNDFCNACEVKLKSQANPWIHSVQYCTLCGRTEILEGTEKIQNYICTTCYAQGRR